MVVVTQIELTLPNQLSLMGLETVLDGFEPASPRFSLKTCFAIVLVEYSITIP